MNEGDEQRVTTLELFFDLVFVFTVTQLTTVLLDELSPIGVARTALLLAVLWWMYGGYAWLTNAVPPVRPVPRLLLVLAMAAFLVVALAAPTAFGAGGLAFALGYLVVVLVHGGLYLTTSHPGNRRGILRILPFNLGAAGMLVGAAFTVGRAHWALWVLAVVLEWVLPLLLGQPRGFAVRADHFVERHGLVLIIAFGESVVAVGIGVSGLGLSPGLLGAAVLAVLVLAAAWWAYFGEDDELAARRLTEAAPERLPMLCLFAYGHAFFVLLAGVIALATGVRRAIGHPLAPLAPGSALVLGVGVALYLAGELMIRRLLRLGPLLPRTLALLAALLSVPVGVATSLVVQLGWLGAVLVAMFLTERRRRSRAG